MCGEKQRAIALQAMQTYLESEVDRLRSTEAGALEQRVEELALVSEQLEMVTPAAGGAGS